VLALGPAADASGLRGMGRPDLRGMLLDVLSLGRGDEQRLESAAS
jgi:hypothetical protein